MKQIKGFLLGQGVNNDADYFFQKIYKQQQPKGSISMLEIMEEEELSSTAAYVLFEKTYTLCISNSIEEKALLPMSYLSNCGFFDFNLEENYIRMSIYRNGKQIGEKKSLFYYEKAHFDELNETQIFQQYMFAFNTLSNGAKLAPNLLTAFQQQSFQKFRIENYRTIYHTNNTYAPSAFPFATNRDKIHSLMPSANGFSQFLEEDFDGSPMTEEKYANRVQEAVRVGVVCPAILLQTKPLVIAVLDFELDAVLILNFLHDTEIAKKYANYPRGTKMLSVNTYSKIAFSGASQDFEVDIIPGNSKNRTIWRNVLPHIVDFIIDKRDQKLLEHKKRAFPEIAWKTLIQYKKEYFKKFPGQYRFGFYMYAAMPTANFIKTYYPDFYDEDNLVGRKKS